MQRPYRVRMGEKAEQFACWSLKKVKSSKVSKD